MAIKFYGVAISIPGARVLACLYEKNLEFELVKTAFKSPETKKEPFLSINPFGQIPALEDGDVKVFGKDYYLDPENIVSFNESRAMTQYLAHAYADKGNQLVSQDHKKMAIITTWMEVESQKFSDVASKLSHELFMGPASGKPINDEVVRENTEKLAKILDVYEVKLKETKYLAGDCFTLADLHHVPVMHYLMNTKVKALFDERPHVSAWRTEILARQAWKKVVELQMPFFASLGAKN